MICKALVVLSLVTGPPVASGQTLGEAEQEAVSSQPTPQDEMRTVLDRLETRASQIKDVVADFEQRKLTPLLKEPLISSGRVWIKGTTVRWDTLKPHRSMMVTDPGQIRIYYPDQMMVEVYQIDQQLQHLIASPVPNWPVLSEYFDIQRIHQNAQANDARENRAQLALRLVPKTEPLRRHITEGRVWVNVESGLIYEVRVTDIDGDQTEIVFGGVKINPGVQDNDIRLVVPPDAEVIHPLNRTSPPDGK